jgi:hypothetical protein
MADKVEYTKPTSLLDLEARLERENRSDAVLPSYVNPEDAEAPEAQWAVEGNEVDNYVGVSPEYMTYANDSDKPRRAEEGAEAEVEKQLLERTSAEKPKNTQKEEVKRDDEKSRPSVRQAKPSENA